MQSFLGRPWMPCSAPGAPCRSHDEALSVERAEQKDKPKAVECHDSKAMRSSTQLGDGITNPTKSAQSDQTSEHKEQMTRPPARRPDHDQSTK